MGLFWVYMASGFVGFRVTVFWSYCRVQGLFWASSDADHGKGGIPPKHPWSRV